VGTHPLQLYSLGTPNGQKVTIMLEELLALGVSGGGGMVAEGRDLRVRVDVDKAAGKLIPFANAYQPAPNGQKVTIMLEELLALGVSGAEYDAWLIRIGEGGMLPDSNTRVGGVVEWSLRAGIFEFGLMSTKPLENAPAILTRHAQRPEGDDHAGGAAGVRRQRRGVRRLADTRMGSHRQDAFMRRAGNGTVDVGERAAAVLLPFPHIRSSYTHSARPTARR
jgi:hypothetical protein